jgi:valyl-tRNA synthetase
MVGKTCTLPLVGREIPIVADEVVDKEFGSGFVKVTPAHDPNDFDIAQRHGLPAIIVIGRDGHMTDEAGADYAGLDRFAARKKVLADLEAQGLLVKTEDYTHSVGHHDRCGTVIEPLLSQQWFVKMEPLARPAIDVVERGEITFYPERWRNVYMSWMTNIRDWCISRQLWWGHRIPVWYCGDCDHLTVAREDPTTCAGCGGTRLRQEEDVLDTWFSSWLWTFSPMGWPDQTRDLERYHPTSVLVTAPEIIFFWVARMIMAALEFVGEIPFRQVFLTGIVRDGKGRKMSKSLGNSPDPLDIIENYGTDAFRFTLAMLSPPGRDVFFDEEKIEMGRNFVNKIWQATRMVTSQLDAGDELWGEGNTDSDNPLAAAWKRSHGTALTFEPELTWEDEWILSALSSCAGDVEEIWRDWRLNDGASRIYDFFWHDYCDWYLELAKIRLYGDGDKRTVKAVLLYVLGESIKMLHPLMPYVTEEIWDKLPMTRELLLRNHFPLGDCAPRNTAVEERMELFRAVVTAARNIRAEYRVNPGAKIPLRIMTPAGDAERRAAIEAGADGIMSLAKVDSLEIGPDVAKEKGSAATPIGDVEVIVPLAGVVDLEEEYRRLGKEREKIEKDLEVVGRKLANENFVNKAAADVVAKERDKQERLRQELDKLIESMSIIKAD